ncbi:hypothetical protein AVEN_208436-1 [Araneus ventricosus]|uniref:Uncharacterized protein n=1 Tax=Araneus ventricosus TaxID=182803 RepID=A0A4Y2EHB9_ARAVE|nr:hypothetical protein AVEN_208436-1 [Araneus ventricosus]
MEALDELGQGYLQRMRYFTGGFSVSDSSRDELFQHGLRLCMRLPSHESISRLESKDNGPEDDLEEIFSDHESFSERDTESEEDGDSGNEDVNNLEWFS